MKNEHCKNKNETRKKETLEKIVKEIMHYEPIEDLHLYHPDDVFVNGDKIIIRLELKKKDRLVDVFDVPTNCSGTVDPKIAAHFVKFAFEMGVRSCFYCKLDKRLSCKKRID